MEKVRIGFFYLKPKLSIKNHFILCSSINEMGKTLRLLPPNKIGGATGWNREFGVGRIGNYSVEVGVLEF